LYKGKTQGELPIEVQYRQALEELKEFIEKENLLWERLKESQKMFTE